jgi:hypothetical protein
MHPFKRLVRGVFTAAALGLCSRRQHDTHLQVQQQQQQQQQQQRGAQRDSRTHQQAE